MKCQQIPYRFSWAHALRQVLGRGLFLLMLIMMLSGKSVTHAALKPFSFGPGSAGQSIAELRVHWDLDGQGDNAQQSNDRWSPIRHTLSPGAQGRIEVRFDLQKNKQYTPWLLFYGQSDGRIYPFRYSKTTHKNATNGIELVARCKYEFKLGNSPDRELSFILDITRQFDDYLNPIVVPFSARWLGKLGMNGRMGDVRFSSVFNFIGQMYNASGRWLNSEQHGCFTGRNTPGYVSIDTQLGLSRLRLPGKKTRYCLLQLKFSQLLYGSYWYPSCLMADWSENRVPGEPYQIELALQYKF